ncbi:hypothetical protein Tco_0952042 [Tanacetum coccineum]|uniref:Uncharacterized protein n=1 Tax=Tanacetum coccineum TaxID=301880 RepID=A0ABQ5DWN2_9ASTR
MNSDIEDDIMDPVMQCTTLPSHSSFSQQKLISFVMEIHTLSIDISLRDCGVKCRLAMTSMHSGESHTGDKNDNNSMDLLLTGNLLKMSTPNAESLLDDDKLYKFKEGDINKLRIKEIKDMLLFLVQGKLTNLTVEECLAFNVSLRMFTRSIDIQRRVEDLQLAYSNPRGFIYWNKDEKNRLMRIDDLHKFSDGTLNDVRIALNDCLKGIQMKYLPQTIWRQSVGI